MLAVDFDPHRLASNQRPGITAVYGSATDLHFLESLPVVARDVHHQHDPRDGRQPHPAPRAQTPPLPGPHRHDGPPSRRRVAAPRGSADTVLEPFSLAAEATTEVLDRLIGDDHDHDR
ncbi:hypothetical protein [Gordonia rhizosphera]|uniref:hypothetical protein n=1 Tax=Gordonia rhizosphera TaxID=83341 RepID=UPI003570D408